MKRLTLHAANGESYALPAGFHHKRAAPNPRQAALAPPGAWLAPFDPPRPLTLVGRVLAPTPERLAQRMRELEAAVQAAATLGAPLEAAFLPPSTTLQPGSGQVTWTEVSAINWRATVTLYPLGEAGYPAGEAGAP